MTNLPDSRRGYFLNVLVCWVVIVGLVGFIFVRTQLAYQNKGPQALTAEVPDPDVGLEINSRLMIGQVQLYSRLHGAVSEAAMKAQREKMVGAIDGVAVKAADQLNAVPVVAELGGSDVAIARLDRLRALLKPNQLLSGDAEALRTIYLHGAEVLTADQRAGLVERHEWFGELALVFGAGANDAERVAILHSATHTTIVAIGVAMVIFLALILGLVLLIVGFVRLKKGRLRLSFQPVPATGPPVFLETFALWLVVWVGSSALLRLANLHVKITMSEVISAVFSLGVALWPIWRGVRWEQLRYELGWTSGRGVVREIFTGVVGYIAGLPILAIALLISMMMISKSASHPTHPIIRELGHDANAVSLVGIYLAACVLAPLIEETMFRGALYRHLRGAHGVVLSAVVVALLFAAIHPQGWTAIPLLGSIALVLAGLREWRGSLISSMTAHAMNNASMITIVLLLLR